MTDAMKNQGILLSLKLRNRKANPYETEMPRASQLNKFSKKGVKKK